MAIDLSWLLRRYQRKVKENSFFDFLATLEWFVRGVFFSLFLWLIVIIMACLAYSLGCIYSLHFISPTKAKIDTNIASRRNKSWTKCNTFVGWIYWGHTIFWIKPQKDDRRNGQAGMQLFLNENACKKEQYLTATQTT